MIQYYKTINGRVRPLEEMEDGCWINVINPDEKEINGLIQEFSLEPDFLRAALDEEESARIEHDGDQTLSIVVIPYVDCEGSGYIYSTIPMGIVLVDEVIIAVCTRDTRLMAG